MINQARANISQPPLGLLGPKIYPLNGHDQLRNITTGKQWCERRYKTPAQANNLCTRARGAERRLDAPISRFVPVPNRPTITNFISYSGDFNGDGRQDILWRDTQTGEVRIWYMNGVTIASNDHVANVSLNWKIAGIGEF